MPILLIAELVSGLAALIVTAMAFTNLSAGEGLPSQTMQRASMTTARRQFWVAGGLWTVCVICYLGLR
ncbi:MAG TPA: hypothetical protein VGM19_09580 [Armatimonadota bacterium]|jgi:hypothetical protein